MRIFAIASLLVIPLVRVENTIVTTNICDVEKKNISCSSDSVICIDSARYGRMTGACLTGYSLLNCSTDVRLYLERKCSGRRSCLLEKDTVLRRSNHRCPAELKTYLEVSHHCLRVETPRNADSSKCEGNKYPVGMTTRDGYIARIVTVETRIGSSTCPWSIEAKSGQTIRLTLYDFGVWQDPETTTPAPGDNHEARPTCHIYAMINERAGSAGARPLCGGVLGNLRQVDGGRVVYTSNSNSVQVTVTTTASPTLEQFLLKYEVVGCADPGPLPQMSVERISDRLVIKCNKDSASDSEPKTWTIQCLDAGNWSTPLNEFNCSTVAGYKYKTSSDFIGSGILLTIAISATVIVAVLVITCGLFILYRREHKPSAGHSQAKDDSYSHLNTLHFGQTDVYASIASREATARSTVGNSPRSTSQMPHYDYVTIPRQQSHSEVGYLSIIG